MNPRRKKPGAKRESPLSSNHQRELTPREWLDAEAEQGANPKWIAMWKRLLESGELPPGPERATAFGDVCAHLVDFGVLKKIPEKGVVNQLEKPAH